MAGTMPAARPEKPSRSRSASCSAVGKVHRYQRGYISLIGDQLAHDGAADVRMFRRAGQEKSFNSTDLPVHERDAALVTMIGAVAQTTNDECCSNPAAQINRKPFESDRLNARSTLKGFGYPRDALFWPEHRAFGIVHTHSDHDLLEQGKRTHHNGNMPDGDRIERAWKNCDRSAHGAKLAGSWRLGVSPNCRVRLYVSSGIRRSIGRRLHPSL